ncbi:putative ABC transport system permease protein [Streptomonospora nanhaiensis]|uniref:Putative ABC transport system permease protein n=1 Tax=Streptomonospora nanhaiensis TaxID=1323731 RepID=A0A853BV13_9ACTN|nr:ABC transporter permease [Streptomonospora nanhaiensis]NYI98357.1 putative ABC transport system permease protein [Streptomonospora nanhaiensis]
MRRITQARPRPRAGRFAATALAIVLGVAFVTATLVFTDSLDARFAAQAEGRADRVDAVALPADPARPLPADGLAKVRELPEVAAAAGTVRGEAVLLDRGGRALGGVPALALSAGGAASRLVADEGRLPAAPAEAALATTSAEAAGYAVGDTVTVVGHDGAEHDFTVTGLVDFGLDLEVAQRGAVVFAPPTARRVTGAEGFGEISVRAAEGVAPERARAALAHALGARAETMTGAEFGRATAEDAGVRTRTIGTALLLFAAVALFVAALVIGNTFAVLVSRGRAETALLRCLGATRGQVFAGVVAEALVVGAVSAGAGVLAGIGAAVGAVRIGAALPGAAAVFGPGAGALVPVVRPGAVLLGLAAGVVATLAAALRPAYLATRTAPLAALREAATADADAVGSRRGARGRLAASGALAAVAAAVTAVGTAAEPGPAAMAVVAGGGLVAFGAVLPVAPLLVSAAARLAAAALGGLGTAARLGAENARRAPRRTAAAVVALAVGAGLITGYTVVSASVQATLAHVMAREMPADYALVPAGSGAGLAGDRRLPPGLAAELRESPAVGEVVRVRRAQARLGAGPGGAEGAGGGAAAAGTGPGGTVAVTAYPGARLGVDLAADTAAGDLADVAPGRVAVAEDTARRLGLGVGDSVALGGDGPGAPARAQLRVAAVAVDFPAGLTLDPADFARLFPDAVGDSSLLVTGAEDADAAEVRAAVERVAADHPGVEVSSAAAQRDQYGRMFDGVFLVVAALLGVAVAIAVVGVGNTLALSVLERGREIALLRALGLTRGGLLLTLAAEALLVAVLGTAVGAGLGTAFGLAAADAAMPDMVPDIPLGRVALLLAAAVPAGLLAALPPARSASRIRVSSLTSAGGGGG